MILVGAALDRARVRSPRVGADVTERPASDRLVDTAAPRAVVWVALAVLKQYCGWPFAHARHCPHTARQFRITRSPTATSVTPSPTAETTPVAS